MTIDTEELQKQLSVFVRVATNLRREKPRNRRQIKAVEFQVDRLRKALGYPRLLDLQDLATPVVDSLIDLREAAMCIAVAEGSQ
jgi:hypothetical protein